VFFYQATDISDRQIADRSYPSSSKVYIAASPQSGGTIFVQARQRESKLLSRELPQREIWY
jgi:hypothetical protein